MCASPCLHMHTQERLKALEMQQEADTRSSSQANRQLTGTQVDMGPHYSLNEVYDSLFKMLLFQGGTCLLVPL